MWTVVQLTLSKAGLPQAEALLQLAGAAAVNMTDAGDTPLLEPAPGETPLWPEVRVQALFEQPVETTRLRQALAGALGEPLSLQERPLESADWHNAWRQHWRPLTFGERLAVVAEDDRPAERVAVVVRLTPGLSFGTGQHPTTALCLEWLVDQDLRNRTVLDYGTGSGLLAIAAVKLGATHAYAVDIDPQALAACAANAERNLVLDQLTVGTPDVLGHESADIVVANILSETLKTLAPQLADRVSSVGALVLSGVLAQQAPEIVSVYQEWFDFLPACERDGWVRLVAHRRPPIG